MDFDRRPYNPLALLWECVIGWCINCVGEVAEYLQTALFTVWLELMLPVLNIHGLSVFCIHFIETLLRSLLCASVLFAAAFMLKLRVIIMTHMIIRIIIIVLLECAVCFMLICHRVTICSNVVFCFCYFYDQILSCVCIFIHNFVLTTRFHSKY